MTLGNLLVRSFLSPSPNTLELLEPLWHHLPLVSTIHYIFTTGY